MNSETQRKIHLGIETASTSDNIPVACRLSDADFRRRELSRLAQFKSAVSATEDLSDGYAFRLPGDHSYLTLLVELMAAERECCPFLTFELSAQPNLGPLTLRVTGPAGAKAFLAANFLQPATAPPSP